MQEDWPTWPIGLLERIIRFVGISKDFFKMDRKALAEFIKKILRRYYIAKESDFFKENPTEKIYTQKYRLTQRNLSKKSKKVPSKAWERNFQK